MDLGVSDKVKPILAEVKQFIDTEILPLEAEFFAEVDRGDRWTHTERQLEILEGLKARARAKKPVEFLPYPLGGRLRSQYSGVRLYCRGDRSLPPGTGGV